MSFDETRKQQLQEHLAAQFALLAEYESLRDLTTDPKEGLRATRGIASTRKAIAGYSTEYATLTGAPPGSSDPASIRGNRPNRTTILFLAASPDNESKLRSDRELEDLRNVLESAKLSAQFDLVSRMALRPQELSKALLNAEPTLVHFSGHGSPAGIMLENDSARAVPVDTSTLSALFALVKSVQCVVLNSCYSAEQAAAIWTSVPCVVGMSSSISDQAAIAYTVGFYQALGAGRGFREAHGFGCVQIMLRGLDEHATPKLHPTV